MCGKDRSNADRLQRFLALLTSGRVDATTACSEAFGLDHRAMERDLRSYLSGGQYFRRHSPRPLGDLKSRLQFRPATDGERNLALLNLRWRVHQSGDAMLTALQLVERDPESPRPRRS